MNAIPLTASRRALPSRWLYWALLFIGVATILSGAVQMIAPRFVMGIVGAETTPTASYCFGIVGMFMVLFGGVLTHGLRATPPHSSLIFWAALQKFGAAIAVSLGVRLGIFASLALAVAVFDLFSGLLAIWFWKRLAAR